LRIIEGYVFYPSTPSVRESGPLLLKLTLGPLACGVLLPELALRHGKHSNLGVEGGL
jgi:hypothetical protein